jgi:adenylate kinase
MDGNIVVTGTPGVGKTEFSTLLSRRLGYECIQMDDIILDNRLYREYDEDRDSYVIDVNKCRHFFRSLYRKGQHIFDSHISHLIIPKKYTYRCVILRCSPYELINRLKRKGYEPHKIIENVQSEILDIIFNEAVVRYGKAMLISVDVTEGISNKLELVIDLIRKGDVLIEHVDWLSLIFEKDDMKTFFPMQ